MLRVLRGGCGGHGRRVRAWVLFTAAASSSSSMPGQPSTYEEISEALRAMGVSTAGVTAAQLKQRYRELVKQHHPDTGGDAATMSRITVAYDRLSGLSRHEWDAYRQRRRACGGGGPGPGGGGGAYAVRGGAGAYARAHGGEGAAAYRDYAQQRAAQEAFWAFYARQASRHAAADGRGGLPFAAYAAAAASSPPLRAGGSLLFLRAAVLYLVVSALLLFVYRRYRDWRHDDGWRMAEQLARHERINELYRIRRELHERLDAATAAHSAAAVAAASATAAGALDDEVRARVYAQQSRRARAGDEELLHMRGWPALRDGQGRLYHRAGEPLGVVVYEPPRQSAQQMQVRNQRLDQARAAAATTAAVRDGDVGGGGAATASVDASTRA